MCKIRECYSDFKLKVIHAINISIQQHFNVAKRINTSRKKTQRTKNLTYLVMFSDFRIFEPDIT